MADTFYITTAINYPNGRPHIGHAYEGIATDVMARFQRLRGRDVRFVTGTDEHGLKMDQTARSQGRATIDLANEMSGHFRDMADQLDLSYDEFVRTTEGRHKAASVELWKRMEGNGDLYLDRYEGWYSVRDEAFYDENELVEGAGENGAGVKLSPQGTPVEWTAEETWFFRLSAYQDRLLAHYHDNPSFIRPESRRNEVLRFVEGGLKDLSVSRTSFDWGVPVPGSEGHVMYVWVDALTTYLTGVGFPDADSDMFRRYWPASIHMIGKDITRFHTVYWPAFLMSAGLALPKQVFSHGFLLARDGGKMSKSAGNVVDPIALAEQYGVDNLRYFFMREIAFGQDGTYSAEAIVTRCNAELANSFGNLAQRTLSMIAKNMDGRLEAFETTERDAELLELVKSACQSELPDAFEQLAFSSGIEAWMRGVFACNQYVDEQAPWTLRKTDPERMKAVLQTLFMAIRDLAIAIQPVVPNKAAAVLDMLGVPGDARDFAALEADGWFAALVAKGHAIEAPTPVFPRLEPPSEAA
ncbi:MAG: methionine--tRNA ligase [Erythrobacter sp.]|jgi:methionyl-tRNA synthetase